MAGGGIGDLFGALGSGLSGLAGQGMGGGGGGGGTPDFGNAPQNAGSNILTNPLVGAEEALNPGTQLLGADQQQQQPQQQQPPNQSNYTPPPQIPQAQGAMQPVQYLPAGAMDPNQAAQANTAPPQVQQPQAPPPQIGAQPGVSQETSTGLTPQAEVAAGYRPPEATDADLAQAAQEKQRNPAAAGSVNIEPAKPPAPPEPQIGASSINTDQQGGQQGQQKQQNPLAAAGNILKNIAKPGSVRDPLTAGTAGGGGNPLMGLLSNLLGLSNQVGSNYGPQQYGSQGATEHGYGYGADQPPAQTAAVPPQQPPSAPQPPTAETPPAAEAPAEAGAPAEASTAREAALSPVSMRTKQDMQPGSAARAIRAGYDRAAAQERPDGSVVPTNGMPGGLTTKASPPAPGLGAIPNQANRPRFYRSKISVNGKEYDFGTGGGQFASLPYGTYNLHSGAIGDIGKRIGAIAGISDSNNKGDNTVHDPLYRGSGGTHARAGVEIHPDVSGGRMITNGCIGVARNQWNDFSRDYRAASAKGPLTLTVGPEGARIQSAQTTAQPTAQQLASNPHELTGIMQATRQLAPGGLPTDAWRPSSNVEDARRNPFMTPLSYPNTDVEGRNLIPQSVWDQGAAAEQEALARAPTSALSQQLGFGNIDTMLDQLAQQWAMQTMGGQVPMPRPRPR